MNPNYPSKDHDTSSAALGLEKSNTISEEEASEPQPMAADDHSSSEETGKDEEKDTPGAIATKPTAETNERNAQANDGLEDRIAAKIVQDRMVYPDANARPSTELSPEQNKFEWKATPNDSKGNDLNKAKAPMPPQSPRISAFRDSSSVLDARIAAKIVQERLAYSNQQEDNEPPPFPQRTQAQTNPSKPGAVPVDGPGLDAASTAFSDLEAATQDDNPTHPQSQAFGRRDHLVEATLVQSQVLAEAELLDESYKENMAAFEEQVHEIKRRYRGAKAILIVCIVFIVIGAVVGGVKSKQDNKSDESNDNAKGSTYLGYPPFHEDLSDLTVEQIENNASSPQALANKWVWEDPYLNNYTDWKKFNRFGLVALYYATNGANWTNNTHWLDYETHECLWYTSHPGPVCNDLVGTFENFNMSGNNLRGTLPQDVRYISVSKFLDFSNNDLGGAPPPLGRGANMEGIIASNNDFSLPLDIQSGWIGPSIRVARLDGNRIEAEFPSKFYLVLPSLVELDVSGNRLTGTLPDDYTMGLPLQRLYFGHNQFAGPFPKTLAKLSNLQEFNISGNIGVRGPLPQEIGLIKNLTLLDISGTSFTGTIPEELCSLQKEGRVELVADCDRIHCCSSSF